MVERTGSKLEISAQDEESLPNGRNPFTHGRLYLQAFKVCIRACKIKPVEAE